MRVRKDFWPYIADRIKVEDRGHGSPCWIWQRWTTEKGYGRASIPGRKGLTRVHRATYEATHGPIPHGLQIDHLCRITGCCNLNHLEAVTGKENAHRAARYAGRTRQPKTHCARGHEKTPANLNKNGACKQCLAIAQRKFAAAHPERIRAARVKRRNNNPEKCRAARRRYRERQKALG